MFYNYKKFKHTIFMLLLMTLAIGLALLATPLAAQSVPVNPDSLLQVPSVDLLQDLMQYAWVQWLAAHAVAVMAILWVLDIVVKLTPTKWDDFTVTFLRALFSKLKGLKR